MINDLLDLTRIEQGRVALDQQPVDAAGLVHDARERFRAEAEDSGILLNSQLASPLPPVLVDRERVEHVFDNLITNALRHTGRGGQVTLGATPEQGSVRFAVQDTGEGIPAAFIPRIFDKFFRTPGVKRPGGAGLGLAIVREIVTAHGGQVDVHSRPGKGTTFTFTLPTAPGPRDEDAVGGLAHVGSSTV
jgi:signal transduction histidine kinase